MRNKGFLIVAILLTIIVLLCITTMRADKGSESQDEWQLIWQYEFDEEFLDTSVWGYMKRGRDDSRKYHSSYTKLNPSKKVSIQK